MTLAILVIAALGLRHGTGPAVRQRWRCSWRAQTAVPDFALTDASGAAVATLCRRLDGSPLAIELARRGRSAMQDAPDGVGIGSYRKVLAAGSVGTLIEVYDVIIYGYLATILARQFFPPSDPTAALLATFAIYAIGSFVRPIGGVIFGHVGDRFGRRSTLSFSLLLMTVATVGFGLLPTYSKVGLLAPVLLLLCRVLQALSASAEIPGAMLLMLEHAPSHRRGPTASINNVASALATAVAATVSLVLARLLSPGQLDDWGWRVAFLIAAPIGLVGLYVRVRLLDSPAFVALGDLARQGRAPLTRALSTAKAGMLLLTVWFGAQTLGGFTLSVSMPSYLIRHAGLPPAEAYAANLIALLVSAGCVLMGGYFIDRLPLRPLAIAVMAGVAITAVPGFLLVSSSRTFAAAVIGQLLCSIFVGFAYPVGAVVAMTVFPTGIRFTAFAVPLAIATALFGSTAPFMTTWLTAVTHSPLAPGIYLAAAAAAGTLAAALVLRRRDAAPQHADHRLGPVGEGEANP